MLAYCLSPLEFSYHAKKDTAIKINICLCTLALFSLIITEGWVGIAYQVLSIAGSIYALKTHKALNLKQASAVLFVLIVTCLCLNLSQLSQWYGIIPVFTFTAVRASELFL